MTPADFDKAYEENEISLRGIIGFGVGLFLLIVITFVLMHFFLKGMYEVNAEMAPPANPMQMTQKEQLPPEPRLQSAPGFGVQGPNGWVNLELREPQAEYRELVKIWNDVLKNGKKDKASGIVTVMPIDEAKAKFLASAPKAKSGADAEKVAADSRMFYSDASSGRTASETRR
ncbi:MAG TPA: hypothetical protein PKA82_15445 [Pyrinomonadaceae bacterium]|nr:hypothetical protein [Pyrinomonadaceae bacterium]